MDVYKLAVSGIAEKIPINSLNNDIKTALSNESILNPLTHDVYKIPIGLEIIPAKSNRKLKKFSIQRTDRIFVEVKVPDERIHLSGIYPTTTMAASGQTSFDFEGDVLFELDFKVLKFKIGGKFKNHISQKKYEIYASRVPPKAQWIYTKSFILSGRNFNNHIICSVPKNMEINRYILCTVESKEKNRTIDKLINKKVELV